MISWETKEVMSMIFLSAEMEQRCFQHCCACRLHLHSVAVPLAGHLLHSHMLLDKNYLILVSDWSLCRFLRLTLFPFPLFSHHLAFPSFPEILKIIDFTDGSQASDRLINKFTSEKPIFHSV